MPVRISRSYANRYCGSSKAVCFLSFYCPPRASACLTARFGEQESVILSIRDCVYLRGTPSTGFYPQSLVNIFTPILITGLAAALLVFRADLHRRRLSLRRSSGWHV